MSTPSPEDEVQKAKKALNKTLKQIQALTGNGEELDADTTKETFERVFRKQKQVGVVNAGIGPRDLPHKLLVFHRDIMMKPAGDGPPPKGKKYDDTTGAKETGDSGANIATVAGEKSDETNIATVASDYEFP